jgi:hypothetical protein
MRAGIALYEVGITANSDEKKRQVALKVLTCWMDGQPPSSEDIQQLRSYKPELAYLQPDELACVVMKDRQNQENRWVDCPRLIANTPGSSAE